MAVDAVTDACGFLGAFCLLILATLTRLPHRPVMRPGRLHLFPVKRFTPYRRGGFMDMGRHACPTMRIWAFNRKSRSPGSESEHADAGEIPADNAAWLIEGGRIQRASKRADKSHREGRPERRKHEVGRAWI